MSKINTKALIEEVVELEEALSQRYGCRVELKVKTYTYPISHILGVVDDVYRESFPEMWQRLKLFRQHQHEEVVMFRSFVFIIAVEAGYTYQAIAAFFRMNHSSVHYKRNHALGLVEFDAMYKKYWTLVKKKFDNQNP